MDPYRLPGTTVDTQRRADGSGQSHAPPTQWAGGGALGEYGTAGMDLAAFACTLRAKKSWFLLDDAVVALGAGIASADNRTIETIIENRKTAGAGDAALMVDGAAQPSTLGWSASLPDVGWAHLDGVAGYVFPGGAAVRALREARTGSWNAINKSANQPATTRNYLTLWFDHGANPAGAAYAYILLPNATADATRASAAQPDVTILRNDAEVQAIRSARLRLTAAHFWRGGAVDFIHSETPAAVIAREENDTLSVAVSDPTQTQDTLTIELDRAAAPVIASDPTVTVTQLAPAIRLTVKVAGSCGASHAVTLILTA